MANTVYLHVGTPKSGTTYLQAVLAANKDRLAEQARVLYPGATWGHQVRATRDALGFHPKGEYDATVEGAWQQLVDEVAAWDGDAVISMEWLGFATVKQARRMVESLSPAQTEVIVTVRDLARTMPAAWQEFVQNWHIWSWEEFVAGVTAEESGSTQAGRLFWGQQDLFRLLAVWRDVLPDDRLHLVTLPPPGAPPGVLWSRFASVLAVDASRFDATGRGANESLGLESTELMRRLSEATRLANLPWGVYSRTFKKTLAKRGLSRRKPNESTPALPPGAQDWVAAYAKQQMAAIEETDLHVVGDVTDLEPHFAAGGISPSDVSVADVLDAAVEGLVFLGEEQDRNVEALRESRQANKRLRRSNQELTETNARLRGRIERHEGPVRTRVRSRLLALSEQRSWVMGIRRHYSRARHHRRG